jgi:Zn-finger nucleic acid-binding protein
MLCPGCKVELEIADRQGVEIDYCPRCRGVWLDRGELDKIVDHAAALAPGGRAGPEPGPARGWGREYDDADEYERGRYRGKRRRGWLGDLLDLD